MVVAFSLETFTIGELIDRDEETDSEDDRFGDELSEFCNLVSEASFFNSALDCSFAEPS